MPTVVQIEDALRTWVLDALSSGPVGERVIIAEQGKPRPERPYADIDIQGIAQRGRDEWRPVDADGLRQVVGQRVARATVQLYGDDAVQLAEEARAELWLETVTDKLSTAGLAFLTAEDVLDITGSIATAIEERGAFDVRFSLASVQTENVGTIDSVEGTGTYLKPNGEVAAVDEFDTAEVGSFMTEGGVPMTEGGVPMVESK